MDLGTEELKKPVLCPKCGGHMKFLGIGEYACDACGFCEYDNYGKVRKYLEEHRGATAYEIEQNTGVRQRDIQKLVRQERIEVSKHSKIFLRCKVCGADIRFGEMCMSCQKKQDAKKNKIPKKKNMSGYGRVKGEEGMRRFWRER